MTWKNEKIDDEFGSFKLITNITDQGFCCTILPKMEEIKPHPGLNQGLRVTINPGPKSDGVLAAIHHPLDVPLLGIRGRFIQTGTASNINVKMEAVENPGSYCVHDEKDHKKLDFGYRFSSSNCIYSNSMDMIKTTCGCDYARGCKTEEEVNCVKTIFGDPYGSPYSHKDNWCLENCKDYLYSLKGIDSMKLNTEPRLCKPWFQALKSQCANDLSDVEVDYSNLCNEVNGVDCEGTPSYENKDALAEYAKDKMIFINVFMEDYYMGINYVYYVTSLKDLFDGIWLNLVIIFGFSLMAIPEVIAYACCIKGGGCL